MARWEPDSAERLARAALDLFAERGYENTTVIDIALRAGLTKSTFFRHFQDKREVLFGNESMYELIVTTTAAALAEATPFEAVQHALDAAAASVFTPARREFIVRRAEVIAATPELREREALKELGLIELLVGALRRRGVPDVAARVAAELSSLATKIAYERWSAISEGEDFGLAAGSALDEVRAASVRWSTLFPAAADK
ncbi:TetR family transcriptional regulator [Glaciihabitans sp. UYNi722]|uniref:TetR/AcrR family transcriptional regulator n=1 Tax=Glaciihabitans sp. UYNi722 TaxID=3156344 RepID=UPI00339308D6